MIFWGGGGIREELGQGRAVRGTLFVHPCTAYSRHPWRENPSDSPALPQYLPARVIYITVSKKL